MTAQILQFTPHNVADAQAELLTTSRAVLRDWQHHSAADVLTACAYLADMGSQGERDAADDMYQHITISEHARKKWLADCLARQDRAARMAFTLPPRREWMRIIGCALAFVAVSWAVLTVLML